jgi:hypothetical protein
MEFSKNISDEKRAFEVAECCLTIYYGDISTYIKSTLNTIIRDNELLLSKLEDRYRINCYLKNIKEKSELFSSLCGELMLNDKNLEKIKIIRKCVDDIITEYQKDGLILEPLKN